MHIQMTQIAALNMTIPVDQARAFLADPTERQDAVRAALADHASVNDTRSNHITIRPEKNGSFAGRNKRASVKPTRVARGEPKEAPARPFVGGKKFECQFSGCDNSFYTQKALNIHMGRKHKSSLPAFARDAESDSL